MKGLWRRIIGAFFVLQRPLPGWLTLCLLFGGIALAAVPVINASLNVPTGGTIIDNNATINTCVGVNGSKQFVYGTNCSTSGGGDTITTPNSTLTVGGTSSATTLDVNLAHANIWTALQTFNLAIAFPATTVTNPSIGVDGDATGDLQLFSTVNILAHQKIVLSNGLNASGGTFAGIGHLGSNTVCALTGTATSTTNAGDGACLITLASSAAAITFHTAITGTSAPICNGTDQTAAGPVKIAITGTSNAWTGYTIAAGTGVGASDVIAVHCIANGGA